MARPQITSHTINAVEFNNANDSVQPATVSAPASCQVPNATTLEACKKSGTDIVIGGSGANQNCQAQVTIAKGVYTVGRITINAGGSLFIADAAAPLDLTTTGIDVNGGSLLIGSPDCPIGTSQSSNKVTIRFTGLKPTDCGTVDLSTPSCPGYVKGIQVEKGGTLKMYGRKGVPGPAPNNGVNWTYLSQPAGDPTKFTKVSGVLEPPAGNSKVDAKVVYTTARVDDGEGGAGLAAWLPGDWIVIATTSFSPWESEFVQIDSAIKDPTLGATGSKITLRQGLLYYHFGGPPPGDPSSDSNFRADQMGIPRTI
ncbi:MAG: G8 domain-containing protein [Deltaproteobacteria bacterium]|nr:G8 domain-containing protein [Deltaproteobacteria bacterium]